MEKRKISRDTIFIILMAIAIVCLIICIVLFVKYKNVIVNEPIQFAIKEYNFSECTCRGLDGRTVQFTADSINVVGGGYGPGRGIEGFGEI